MPATSSLFRHSISLMRRRKYDFHSCKKSDYIMQGISRSHDRTTRKCDHSCTCPRVVMHANADHECTLSLFRAAIRNVLLSLRRRVITYENAQPRTGLYCESRALLRRPPRFEFTPWILPAVIEPLLSPSLHSTPSALCGRGFPPASRAERTSLARRKGRTMRTALASTLS